MSRAVWDPQNIVACVKLGDAPIPTLLAAYGGDADGPAGDLLVALGVERAELVVYLREHAALSTLDAEPVIDDPACGMPFWQLSARLDAAVAERVLAEAHLAAALAHATLVYAEQRAANLIEVWIAHALSDVDDVEPHWW
jgi:hypothetical protein